MNKTIRTESYFFLRKVEKHQELKKTLLDSINSMGTHSCIEMDQKISNTDWHLDNSYHRPYLDIVRLPFEEHLLEVFDKLKLQRRLRTTNCWFQQYQHLDYHNWHTHNNAQYSSIYYLELPEATSKTTFKVLDDEFEVDVNEGDILTFPASYTHCSKPNKSNDRKTIISFNSN